MIDLFICIIVSPLLNVKSLKIGISFLFSAFNLAPKAVPGTEMNDGPLECHLLPHIRTALPGHKALSLNGSRGQMPSARVVGEGQPKLPCPGILAYEEFCFPTSHLGLRGNGPLRPGSVCGDRTGDRETTRRAAPFCWPRAGCKEGWRDFPAGRAVTKGDPHVSERVH